ncbi:DUF397 domain-containing protein [Nocardia pseudobrasiliensis]|uniref:DUF397 domain-containing protein n=1 Tax=Nocardia pseudobrasiliensis TaxID=45979 RepID=UPI0009ED875E|nr:DUF397 domain-containing protein [Nocardia pseudobrasiliensis]
MTGRSEAAWYKSSRSKADRACVEVAHLDAGLVGVRDSKDPTGPALIFAPGRVGRIHFQCAGRPGSRLLISTGIRFAWGPAELTSPWLVFRERSGNAYDQLYRRQFECSERNAPCGARNTMRQLTTHVIPLETPL